MYFEKIQYVEPEKIKKNRVPVPQHETRVVAEARHEAASARLEGDLRDQKVVGSGDRADAAHLAIIRWERVGVCVLLHVGLHVLSPAHRG